MMESSVRRRLIVVFFLVLVGLVGLGIRLYQLMLEPEKQYSASRSKSYQGYCVLPAQRGRILDRDMRPLATDRAAWSLYVSGDLKDRQEFLDRTAQALAINDEGRQAMERRLPLKSKQVVRLVRGISGEKYGSLIKSLEPFAEDKTVRLDPEFPRYYPEGQLAANVIGFVGSDQIGRGGIEYQYQDCLEGKRELVVIDVDARRKFMPDSDYTKEAGVKGRDVILTIDSYVQLLVERELQAVVDQTGAIQASAMVVDPENGEILALGVVPSFDPNRFNEPGIDEFRRKCRPITDRFEPGSVVKPFIVAAALESGRITPQSEFFCENGRYEIPGRSGRTLHTIRDDIHKYGNLSVRDILVRSSNIGICKIAVEMGKEAVYEILTRFGFGSVSGVDLPGEQSGVLPSPSSRAWNALSIYSIPYGQGLDTNCLVVATAYATLANRGIRVQPHVVKGYRHPTNATVTWREIPQAERILDPGIAETVIDMLVAVTEDPEGTGYDYCRIPGFRIAGKTGTAQKPGPGGYQRGKRVSSWAGFFPADDPEVVIFVVVDEPKKGKYGGEVAGPVFTRIAKGLISYWGLIPDETHTRIENLLTEKTSGVNSAPSPSAIAQARPQAVVPGVMPDLSGMSIREAYLTLIQSGLQGSFDGNGWVVSQETDFGESPGTSHVGRIVLKAAPNSSTLGSVLASARLADEATVGKPE